MAKGQIDSRNDNEPNRLKAGNFIKNQEYDSAIFYYSKSLKIALRNRDKVSEVKMRLKLSDCYCYKNDFKSTLSELEAAELILNQIQNNPELEAAYMASLAYYHYSRKEYAEAEILFLKLTKTKNEKQLDAHVFLASIYSEQDKVSNVVFYLSKFLMTSQNDTWLKYSYKISYTILGLVETAHKTGKYRNQGSIYNLVRLLSARDTFSCLETRAYHYYCMGAIYNYFEDYSSSNRYLLKALSEYNSITKESKKINLAWVNSSIANNLYRVSDYTKAEKYFEAAILYLKAARHSEYKIHYYYWYSYARNAFGCRQYPMALARLDSALRYTKLVGNNENANLYNCYGLTYTKLREYGRAEDNYKKAITFRKKEKNVNIKDLSKDYQNYSELLVLLGRKDEAIEMGKESCRLIRQVMGEKSGSTSIALSSLGGIYRDCGMYREALETYNAAILAASSDSSLGKGLFPGTDMIVYSAEFIRALKGKAFLLHTMAGADKAKRKGYLLQSLACYIEAIDQMEKLRSGYQFDEGKLMLAENERYVYDEALKTATDLYFINNDRSYLHIAFNIAERAKAAVLLGKVSLLSDMSGNGRYDRLFMLDQKIRREISICENYVSGRSSAEVSGDVNRIKERLFKLYEFQEKFFSVLRADFPEYYDTWVDPPYASITEVQQKLKEDECMVEYHLADLALYTFVISPGDCRLYKKDLPVGFEELVQNFIKKIEPTGPEALTENNFRQFTEYSYSIYKTLLGPFEKDIQGRSLIIVSDEILNYIPFEVLLTMPAKKDRTDYRTLPYLLKEHSISYAGSSTVCCYVNNGRKGQGRSLLAFAPDYKDPGEKTKEALKEIDGYTLKGASDEVKSVGENTDGIMYLGSDATENNFKNNASGYGILHLAMHGESDAENPFNSKLIFEKGGEGEDGILYAWEIYNMQIDPAMVVLSACNTGTGRLRGGEGVMSLARAFIYAGSPSVVMTLWTVSDLSSTDIMKNFYVNLSDGDDKALALQKAKLKYLDETGAINAHPGCWAGYVIVGDRSPLFNAGWGYGYIILLIVSIIYIVISLMVIRRRRANQVLVYGRGSGTGCRS